MPGIIKASGEGGDAPSGARPVFNFEDMGQRARAYLADVRREAETILQDAQQEAAEMRRRAVLEGREEALRQARAEVPRENESRLRTTTAALSQAAERLEAQREAWQAGWEREAVRLAVRIAGKIVRRELRSDPTIPVEWVRAALEITSRQEEVTIELCPSDLATLGAGLGDLERRLGRAAPTHVVANPDLGTGDVRVTTRFGEVELALEEQLQRIERELA